MVRAAKAEPSLLQVRQDGLERFRANTTVLPDGRLLAAFAGHPREGTLRIWFLVWGTPFGMCVRAVVELATGIRQFVLLPGDADFAALKAGRVVIGFWRGGKLREAMEFDYRRADYAVALAEIAADVEHGQEKLSMHPGVFLDRGRVLDNSFGSLFEQWHTRLDWLQVGWLQACRDHYPALRRAISDLPAVAVNVSAWSGLADFPTLTALLETAGLPDPSERLRCLADAFDDPRAAVGFLRDMHSMSKRRAEQHASLLSSAASAFTMLQLVWGARSLSRATSDSGRRQAFTDGYSLLDGRFEIDFANFAIKRDKDAQEYWTASALEPLFDAPSYLDPWDMPADLPGLAAAWGAEPVNVDPEAVEPTIRGLIAEAASLRRWTIPPRACVPMRVGPFAAVELTEIGDEVYFAWRTAVDRYWITSVGVRECTFNTHLMADPDGKGPLVDASIRLLMAALVRDFWVADERRAIFDVTTDRRQRQPGRERQEPRVVYLPRVRYGNSDVGLARLSSGLLHAERSRHYVRPFLRKAHASPVQAEIARRHRVELPAGHTWVKGHYRGGGEGQTVYRSRSAMNLLYEVLPPGAEGSITSAEGSWFDFERSIAKLLEDHLGFTVIDRAVRGRGDQGIDVLATKLSGGRTDLWVVQCKHYLERNPVGPGTVRELIGAMVAVRHDDGQAVRGLLVTSGRVSGDALKLCASHGIQSYDGAQLATIAGAVNREAPGKATADLSATL